METKLTTIYFISDGIHLKIGRSNSLTERFESLQTGNPNKLKLLYIINNVPTYFEQHIHGVCEAFHIKNEWFALEAIDHLFKCPWYRDNMLKIRN